MVKRYQRTIVPKECVVTKHRYPQFSKAVMEKRAKEMRDNPTYYEALAKNVLNGLSKELHLTVMCQHVSMPYIVDFYIPEIALVIEIDGAHHFESGTKEYDDRRTHLLKSYGVEVTRFYNKDVESSGFYNALSFILNEYTKKRAKQGVSTRSGWGNWRKRMQALYYKRKDVGETYEDSRNEAHNMYKEYCIAHGLSESS